ncbi:MAG: SEL1-like repeat protein [Marinicaulis sp.]|nr:SEL1-like repeat protein [Marinicaulis sp.]
MKSSAPWSVKGIERDARETAKEAAKREGMTVGEWLNQIIYRSGSPEDSDGAIEGLKLRDVVTAVEHLNKRTAEAEAKNLEAVGEMTRNVGGMVERIQRLERVKPPEGSNSDLTARLEKLEKAGGDRQRIDALKALEKAVSQIAAQFNNSHKTSLQRLDDNERQLQEISQRIESAGIGDDNAAGASFLKNAIEELTTRITRAERIANEAAELKAQATGSANTTFVERTGERLRVLGDEIKRGEDQIRGFENTITKLSAQIDAAERRSAEGVQKITDVVSDLRDQLDADNAPSDALVDNTPSVVDASQNNEPEVSENLAEDINTQIESSIDHTTNDITPLEESNEETIGLLGDLNIGAGEAFGFDFEDEGETKTADERQFMVDDTTSDDEDEEAPDSFDDEIEAAIEDPSATGEDFSFDLDESESEGSKNAKALLSEIKGVFSGLRPAKDAQSPDAETDTPSDDEAPSNTEHPDTNIEGADIENDLNAILSHLGDEPIGSNQDIESDVADKRSAAKALLFGGTPSISKLPADENSPEIPATDPRVEDFLQEARRRAKQSAEEMDGAKRTRRNLTPKQRAILAARARQKRLSEGQMSGGQSSSLAKPEKNTPPHSEEPMFGQPEPTPANTNETEELEDNNTFISKMKAISAKLPFIGKPQNKDHDQENEAADIPTPNGEAEENNTAFSTLKASTTAKPVTWALGIAILLAAAALFYLVSDLVTKSPNAPAQRQTATVTTTNAPTANAGDANSEALSTANTTPTTEASRAADLPTIDPRTLYLESMAALNTATGSEETTTAIGALEQSAALGHPPAQLQLGELFKIGQGVDQDLGQARTWFRRAANGGNVLAMHRIGVMTARGDGGLADTGEAIGWFELAANRGLIDSQYNLGAIYHPTNSSSASSFQDAGKAYYWYSLAAKNGDDQAAPLATSVGGALTLAERNQIDAEIAAWAALPTDADANEMAAVDN